MNSITNISPSNLYFLNSLFDLSLGNCPVTGLQQSTDEMTVLFIPLAGPSDRVLLDAAVPDDYREYLSSCGLDCPQTLNQVEFCNDMNGISWGWNTESVKKLERAGAQCKHPDLAVVKEVNSRKFSYMLNRETDTGVPGAKLVESIKQLHLSLGSWQQFPLVIKPLFGNAGYGFIRKDNTVLTESELKQVEFFIGNDGGVIIEPWYARLSDISSRCFIDSEGTIIDIRHHRTLSNRAGAFFADWLDPADATIINWYNDLERAVNDCALRLYTSGYWGPVGFDSFIWKDNNGNRKLAAVIEINARHPMSSIAYALYDKLTPGKVSTFRFVSKKRHTLPDNYKSFLATFGKSAFNRKTKEGIILVTPLRLCHDTQWIQPARSAFFIAANTSEELLAIDEWLRSVLS
jgi:hypothetical protein